jgi:membrane protein YdbS with pleckstrin-like domain
MTAFNSNSVKPDAPLPDNRPKRDEDAEIVYYEGRPVMRAQQMKAILWAIIGLALLALPVVAMSMHWTFWTWWLSIICVLLAAMVIAVPWIKLRAIKYRITSYRIDYERGILTKRIDTLELWHVEDISFQQGLLDRMMNVGSVIVMSNDETTPKLELHGIPNARLVFDELKDRVIAVKRQRGVIKVDSGT